LRAILAFYEELSFYITINWSQIPLQKLGSIGQALLQTLPTNFLKIVINRIFF